MPDVQWYYARNDQQFGPVTAAELKQLADEGRIAPDDLLWRDGMEQWATAINLRGLFSDDEAAGATPSLLSPAAGPAAASHKPPRLAGGGVSLRAILRTTQLLLWSMCVLVVLAGTVLFTRAFLIAETATEEAAAAAVFAAFFIASYVLARSGEKLSRLLLARMRRR
jgi:hypothetical protein